MLSSDSFSLSYSMGTYLLAYFGTLSTAYEKIRQVKAPG
jgi:hypothetical protein